MDFDFESPERCPDCGGILKIAVESGVPVAICQECSYKEDGDMRGHTVRVTPQDGGYLVRTSLSFERRAETADEAKVLIIAARAYIWGWTDREEAG